MYSVRLEQGTVTSLIEENGSVKGIQYKTKAGQELKAHAPLTVVCDGCFSNLRRSLCNPKVNLEPLNASLDCFLWCHMHASGQAKNCAFICLVIYVSWAEFDIFRSWNHCKCDYLLTFAGWYPILLCWFGIGTGEQSTSIPKPWACYSGRSFAHLILSY